MWPYDGILGSRFSVVIYRMFDSYAAGLVVYFKWENWCVDLILLIKQFIFTSLRHCANNVKFHKLDLLINQVVNISQHVIGSHHLQKSACWPHGEPALSSDCKHLIHLHAVICLSSATEEAHSRGE